MLMLVAASGCLPSFPLPEDPYVRDSDSDTDTDADADADSDADTDSDADADPTQVVDAEADAEAVLGGRLLPAGGIDADGDAVMDLVLAHPFEANPVPASWSVFERLGFGFSGVPGLVDRPFAVGQGSGGCLDDGGHPLGAFQVAVAADGRDVVDAAGGPPDGYDDLAVAAPSSTNGGGYVALVHAAGAPLGAGGAGAVTGWCYDGPNLLGYQVLLVGDGGDGRPSVAASLSYGPQDAIAGVAVFDAVAPGAAPIDALAEAASFVTISESAQGGSPGGAIGAADLDGDGAVAFLIGTIGDEGPTPYDPPRVYLLDQGRLGRVDHVSANAVIAATIDGDITGVPTSAVRCGAPSIVGADVDGDGADDLVLGFPQDDRVVVVGAVSAGNLAADAPAAAVGEPDGCFGAALDAIGDLDADGYLEVAIGAPDAGADAVGAAWLIDGYTLAHGVVDVAAGGARVAFTPRPASAGVGWRLGTAVVGGDFDGDGVPDVVIGESGFDGSKLFLHAGTGL